MRSEIKNQLKETNFKNLSPFYSYRLISDLAYFFNVIYSLCVNLCKSYGSA